MTEPRLPSPMVLDALRVNGHPMTIDMILDALSIPRTMESARDCSNRCGYLVSAGQVTRLSEGIYQFNTTERKPMTDTSVSITIPSTFVCDECGHVAPSQMGLRAHITRTHKTTDADQLFALVGAATEALFPTGVPVSRIIEIAELQKAMLRVVAR